MVSSIIDIGDLAEAFPEFDGTIEPLDEGGFKSVYTVEADGQLSVLKIYVVPSNSSWAEEEEGEQVDVALLRTVREVEFLARIDSPHLVKVISGPSQRSVGDRVFLFYVEEHLPGGTLASRISNALLTQEECRTLAVSLLRGVHTLSHDHQVVHRDLKPANIMFDRDDRVKIIDLGAAYFAELDPLTQSDLSSPGTHGYAAPEQYEQRRQVQIDVRTDLFAIGVICYQAATGRLPFGPNPRTREYAERASSGQLPDLSIFDADLQEFLHRCLQPRQHQRYRDAAEALYDFGVDA